MADIPFPTIQFSSWNNSELADPIGTRHLVSGAFAYDKLIGLGCDLAMAFGNLVLDAGTNEPFTESKVAVVNICVPNMGELQASGVTAVYNMRIWIPSDSGTVIDLPGSHLEYFTSGLWVPNVDFPSGHGIEFSRSLPVQFNLLRHNGQAELSSYNDEHVSQYIYMKLFLDERFPVGTYGICGSGVLRPALTFDFY